MICGVRVFLKQHYQTASIHAVAIIDIIMPRIISSYSIYESLEEKASEPVYWVKAIKFPNA